MIDRIVNAFNIFQAFKGLSWMLFFLIRIAPAQAQSVNTSDFLSQYNALINAEETGNDVEVDSTVKRLLALHEKEKDTYDSLVVSMLIWHYHQKSESISPAERILLLRTYQKIIHGMHQRYPAEMARFYSLYIPVFRYHYQTDSIAHYLDLIEEQLDKIKEPVRVKIGWFYEKGRLAFGQGDYEAALTFTMRGLEYLDQNFPDQTRMKYLLMNAIGIGYRRMGRPDEAIGWYEDILQKNESEVHSVRMTGALLNNLGLAYKDCGEWDNAILRLSEAITYYTKTFSPTYEDIGSGYDNIAICYQSMGDLANALRYSQKSLEFISSNLGSSHPDLLLPMNSITSTYLQDGKINAARDMNLKALALMRKLGWQENDPQGDYYLADGFDVLAFALDIQRAFYDVSADTAYLHAAIKAGTHFMTMTDYAYDHLKNDLSKELFQTKHSKVFSACIRDVYDLYEKTHARSLIEQAFAYSEKFKSLELLYAAQKDKAEHVVRYGSLNQKYNSLTDSIRFYEDLFHSTENDPLRHQRAISDLNRHKVRLYQWKEQIRKNHADYYQLIYHPEPISLHELQEALHQHEQCMVSYHLAEDAVYTVVLTRDTVHFLKNKLNEDLPGLISRFRNAVYGYFSDTAMTESTYLKLGHDFAESGSLLYNMLMAPLHKVLTARVVIIVDKVLGYVPFDLLLSKKPTVDHQYRDHSYVLHEHAISYSYSARLWMDMRRHTFSGKYDMLAMAPSFPPYPSNLSGSPLRQGLGPLYFNEVEVDHIHRVIPGRIFKGKEATKNNFIQNCSGYRLIHLATHSKANDEQSDYSFLAFTGLQDEGSRLMASEIYNLDLEAELVTLSACETGMGQLRSGEGIISLARAFTYAGARSIVSSLWSVNDKSTSMIMTAFYQYLKAGEPKDIAMQRAKSDFIRSMGHADAHPFYWGSFICVGDMASLEITGQTISTRYLALFTIAGAVILIFLIKKRLRLGTPPA